MTSTGPKEVGGTTPKTQFFEGDFAFESPRFDAHTKIYEFVGCFATWLVLVVGAVMCFVDNPQPYLFLFVTFLVLWPVFPVGTIVSFIRTGFLIEFAKQLKLMFKRVHIVATIVFLAIIAMSLVLMLILSDILGLLCIIIVMLQCVAFLWHTLLYIPSVRTAVL